MKSGAQFILSRWRIFFGILFANTMAKAIFEHVAHSTLTERFVVVTQVNADMSQADTQLDLVVDRAASDGSALSLLDLNDAEREHLKLLMPKWGEQKSLFTIMECLIQLVQPIQRHRGSTIGFLGGEPSFALEIKNTAGDINRQIYFLHELNQSNGKVISDNEVDQIIYAWSTISKDWQQDRIIENFEYHSFLIENILKIITNCANRLASWQSSVAETGGMLLGNQISGSLPLIKIMFCDLMNLIEILAKLRGLGVCAIAAANSNTDTEFTSDDHQRMRLKYLVQEFRYKKEELDNSLKSLSKETARDLPTLRELRTFDMQSDKLIRILNNDFLTDSSKLLDTTEYYDLCTELIGIYFQVVDQGIYSIEGYFSRQFQRLISMRI